MNTTTEHSETVQSEISLAKNQSHKNIHKIMIHTHTQKNDSCNNVYIITLHLEMIHTEMSHVKIIRAKTHQNPMNLIKKMNN